MRNHSGCLLVPPSHDASQLSPPSQKHMNPKLKYITLATILSVALPLIALGEGQNCNGECGDPTPTPAATATPTPPGATPTPPPASPTPNPLTSGAAADETSVDNQFVTIELQTENPSYTARNFQATDLLLNVIAHFNARLTTFRGFYVGSNRGVQTNPVSTAPITDPAQLTQAPTPAPSASPTPSPSPGQKPAKVRKKKTAKQFADDGNDNNCVDCTGNNVPPGR